MDFLIYKQEYSEYQLIFKYLNKNVELLLTLWCFYFSAEHKTSLFFSWLGISLFPRSLYNVLVWYLYHKVAEPLFFP